MSVITIVVVCLVAVSLIFTTYAIGLVLSPSHTATRSAVYNTTAEILWAILTSVEDYPAWRSNIDRVVVRRDEYEEDLNKYEERLTFVEHTKTNKKTVVMHIVQEPEKKLLRVLEESPEPKRRSTFTGSWIFSIEPVIGNEKQVKLKITEQGVIHKPMVRATHRLLVGHHRRIDRFLKDLGKEIDLGLLKPEDEEEEEDREVKKVEEEDGLEEFEERPDESMMIYEPHHMLESKILEKDWDMMSEVYERKGV